MQKHLVIFQISLYMSMYLSRYFCKHDDVIEWKHFPRYWPFVRGIQRSPVNSPHKGQWREALVFSLICALNKRLSKQSWGWWFEMPTRSLWLHCNECLRCCHQTSQGLCVTHRKQLSVVQNAMISIHAHLICMKEPACVCDLCGICYFENGINHQGITRPLCQIWLAEWILSASNPTILYDCWLLLWHQMNENGYVVSQTALNLIYQFVHLKRLWLMNGQNLSGLPGFAGDSVLMIFDAYPQQNFMFRRKSSYFKYN